MPKSPPKKPATKRTPASKASKPAVQPLAHHLAELLNPALVRAKGFGEAPQAGFDAGDVTGLDPKLAGQLGPAPERHVAQAIKAAEYGEDWAET